VADCAGVPQGQIQGGLNKPHNSQWNIKCQVDAHHCKQLTSQYETQSCAASMGCTPALPNDLPKLKTELYNQNGEEHQHYQITSQFK
jgi:hypothetical protein